jgi:hypothetical protein
VRVVPAVATVRTGVATSTCVLGTRRRVGSSRGDRGCMSARDERERKDRQERPEAAHPVHRAAAWLAAQLVAWPLLICLRFG